MVPSEKPLPLSKTKSWNATTSDPRLENSGSGVDANAADETKQSYTLCKDVKYVEDEVLRSWSIMPNRPHSEECARRKDAPSSFISTQIIREAPKPTEECLEYIIARETYISAPTKHDHSVSDSI